MAAGQKPPLSPPPLPYLNGGGGGAGPPPPGRAHYQQLKPSAAAWRGDPDEEAIAAALRQLAAVRARRPRAVAVAAALALLFLVLLHPGARYHAGEGLRAALGVRRRQLDVPRFGPSTDSGGLCRLEYTVRTWDGRNAPACDPNVCAGRRRLRTLELPRGDAAARARRWSPFHEAAYLEMFRQQRIAGWLQPAHIHYVKALTQLQHRLGVYGAVGEIGVHHGKFLIPIVGNALAGEPAVAIDLFEDQASNVDTSGRGSTPQLLANLEAAGLPERTVRRLAGNSMQLTPANLTAAGLPAFRLLSVDGGHTLEITLHDLMLASCVVADGGLVVLDDYPNPAWQGVAEALFHFVHAQDRLVPFLHGFNKVYFATAGHVDAYRRYVASRPDLFPCAGDHASKQTIAGHHLCWTAAPARPKPAAAAPAKAAAAPAKAVAPEAETQKAATQAAVGPGAEAGGGAAAAAAAAAAASPAEPKHHR